MSLSDVIKDGLMGFPECKSCACYPECRNDCNRHLQCVERLPIYAEGVFGSDQSKWPTSVLAGWNERGYKLWKER